MLKRCSLAKNPEPDESRRKTRLLNELKEKTEKIGAFPSLRLSIEGPKILKTLYETLNSPTLKKKFLKLTSFNVYFAGNRGVDAGGLTNQFFQIITDTITDPDNKVFVPITEGAGVFIPNHGITSTQIKNLTGQEVSKELFFEFIGMMVFRLVTKGYGIKLPLAKSLLLRLLHRDAKINENKDEFIFHSYEDNNNINTMVETFNYTVQEANDIYVEEFENPQDVIDYLYENAKEQSYFDNEAIKGFVKGFHTVSKNLYAIFAESKYRVKDLHMLITSQRITKEQAINILIPQLKNVDQYPDVERPIVEACHKILKNEVPFPTEYVERERQISLRSTNRTRRNRNYPNSWEEFMELLLYFWTGKKILMKSNEQGNKGYKLLTRNSDREQHKNFIVESHTCFFQLVLGYKIGDGETIDKRAEELYKRLIVECSEISFNAA